MDEALSGGASTNARTIRDPQFAKRLEIACGEHAHVPAKHSGRLIWIQKELGRTPFDERVSVETVRKWFAGEAKPRPIKLSKLAKILDRDEAWLSLGVDPRMPTRERKVRNAMADGAVNLVAGLIQMDGGYPAFPNEKDNAAIGNGVDLHAIIKGAKYDFHVSIGEVDGPFIKFSVPMTHESLVVLGLIKESFNIEIFEIPSEVIESGKRRGGSVEVIVEGRGAPLRKINNFMARP